MQRHGHLKFFRLSHKMYARVGPAAMKLPDTDARAVAGGSISIRAFVENAMCRLSAMLCHGIAVQARAAAPR